MEEKKEEVKTGDIDFSDKPQKEEVEEKKEVTVVKKGKKKGLSPVGIRREEPKAP